MVSRARRVARTTDQRGRGPLGALSHMASHSPRSIDALHIRSGLTHDPARVAKETLAAIKDHAEVVQAVPTPQTLSGPPAGVSLSLIQGNMGQTIGRGHTCKVYLSRDDPQFVIKQVDQEHEPEFRKELFRAVRLPTLSVINTIYAADGPRALMPRLWPARLHEVSAALNKLSNGSGPGC